MSRAKLNGKTPGWKVDSECVYWVLDSTLSEGTGSVWCLRTRMDKASQACLRRKRLKKPTMFTLEES